MEAIKLPFLIKKELAIRQGHSEIAFCLILFDQLRCFLDSNPLKKKFSYFLSFYPVTLFR